MLECSVAPLGLVVAVVEVLCRARDRELRTESAGVPPRHIRSLSLTLTMKTARTPTELSVNEFNVDREYLFFEK